VIPTVAKPTPGRYGYDRTIGGNSMRQTPFPVSADDFERLLTGSNEFNTVFVFEEQQMDSHGLSNVFDFFQATAPPLDQRKLSLAHPFRTIGDTGKPFHCPMFVRFVVGHNSSYHGTFPPFSQI
jgi:hypothetical protein